MRLDAGSERVSAGGSGRRRPRPPAPSAEGTWGGAAGGPGWERPLFCVDLGFQGERWREWRTSAPLVGSKQVTPNLPRDLWAVPSRLLPLPGAPRAGGVRGSEGARGGSGERPASPRSPPAPRPVRSHTPAEVDGVLARPGAARPRGCVVHGGAPSRRTSTLPSGES